MGIDAPGPDLPPVGPEIRLDKVGGKAEVELERVKAPPPIKMATALDLDDGHEYLLPDNGGIDKTLNDVFIRLKQQGFTDSQLAEVSVKGSVRKGENGQALTTLYGTGVKVLSHILDYEIHIPNHEPIKFSANFDSNQTVGANDQITKENMASSVEHLHKFLARSVWKGNRRNGTELQKIANESEYTVAALERMASVEEGKFYSSRIEDVYSANTATILGALKPNPRGGKNKAIVRAVGKQLRATYASAKTRRFSFQGRQVAVDPAKRAVYSVNEKWFERQRTVDIEHLLLANSELAERHIIEEAVDYELPQEIRDAQDEFAAISGPDLRPDKLKEAGISVRDLVKAQGGDADVIRDETKLAMTEKQAAFDELHISLKARLAADPTLLKQVALKPQLTAGAQEILRISTEITKLQHTQKSLTLGRDKLDRQVKSSNEECERLQGALADAQKGQKTKFKEDLKAELSRNDNLSALFHAREAECEKCAASIEEAEGAKRIVQTELNLLREFEMPEEDFLTEFQDDIDKLRQLEYEIHSHHQVVEQLADTSTLLKRAARVGKGMANEVKGPLGMGPRAANQAIIKKLQLPSLARLELSPSKGMHFNWKSGDLERRFEKAKGDPNKIEMLLLDARQLEAGLSSAVLGATKIEAEGVVASKQEIANELGKVRTFLETHAPPNRDLKR